MNKTYGGFFPLDIPNLNNNIHREANNFLWCGRACLSLLVERLNIKTLWLPDYICRSISDINNHLGIEVVFYNIDNNFEIVDLPKLKNDAYILYPNYFGLKRSYVFKLLDIYNDKLILDNTHDYFDASLPVKYKFNSARKFFGVMDGAFMYGLSPCSLEENNYTSSSHLLSKYLNPKKAYEQYCRNESKFSYLPLLGSNLSRSILNNINYDTCAQKRKENYLFLESVYGQINRTNLKLDSEEIPYCFPLLLDNKVNFNLYHKHGLYVPYLWPLQNGKTKNAVQISQNLLILPIDQRYSLTELEEMVKLLNSLKQFYL